VEVPGVLVVVRRYVAARAATAATSTPVRGADYERIHTLLSRLNLSLRGGVGRLIEPPAFAVEEPPVADTAIAAAMTDRIRRKYFFKAFPF
jgi:hypothetical protein